jgi:hypothetical protein
LKRPFCGLAVLGIGIPGGFFRTVGNDGMGQLKQVCFPGSIFSDKNVQVIRKMEIAVFEQSKVFYMQFGQHGIWVWGFGFYCC